MEFLILYLHRETDAAWLVSERPESDRAWLPKSQCDQISRSLGAFGEPDLIELEIPEWLATAKGFI